MFHPKMSTIRESSNHQKFDIWLFAVDLVNYVFLKSSTLPQELVAGHFPAFACQSFNETLQTAVKSIKDTVQQDVDEDFAKFKQRNDVTPEAYTKYAKELRNTRYHQRFDAEAFLYYVVHLAFLAYRFYHWGVRKAQIAAVFCIAEDFRGCNLKYGFWEAIDEIAGRIVCGPMDKSLPTYRSLLCGVNSKNINYFVSPEVDHKGKGNYARSNIDDDNSSIIDPSAKQDCSDEDLSKPKHYSGEIFTSSCTKVTEVIKGNPLKVSLSFTFHESFESSLEYLSRTSILPVKILNDDGTSNSTPEDSSGKWKRGILKRRISKNTLEKQIFKLSPINRIKAESVNFK